MAHLTASAKLIASLLPGIVLTNCLLLKAQSPMRGIAPGATVRMVPTDWSIL